MHNHVANSGRKALLKQIFSVFLIFTLYFNSFSVAHASTFGGWSIGGLVANGASSIVNGTKQVIIDGKNYIKKGTATITPTASQVSKVLARGAAGYALSVAVEQLLGSVDWVLDPANNRVVYYESNKPDIAQPYDEYFYHNGWDGVRYSSPNPACQALLKNPNYKSYTASLVSNTRCNLYYSDGSLFTYFSIYKVQNPAYDPAAEEEREEKSIPLDTVAQQVISNAESGDTNAQAATTAAAQDIINEAEQDEVKARPIVQQLEASASTENADSAAQEAANDATGTQTKNPTNPDVTDLSLEFPVFCGWAPIVCEAAQTVISFPQTLTNWWDTATTSISEAWTWTKARYETATNSISEAWTWTKARYEAAVTSISEAWTWTKARYEAAVTSISDFFKNEPIPDSDNSLPVQEIPMPQLNTGTFQATAGCPEPIPINITIGIQGTSSISYEPICQFASKWSFVAPLIGFLSGAMILVGVGRKGEDSEI